MQEGDELPKPGRVTVEAEGVGLYEHLEMTFWVWWGLQMGEGLLSRGSRSELNFRTIVWQS